MNMKAQMWSRRGVTLTELLVVLLIIGLLATIAVPVYITKTQQARIAIAQAEARELATAEEHCALVHGLFVPLQLLDDNNDDPTTTANQDDDSLENETDQLYLINPFRDLEQQRRGSPEVQQPQLSWGRSRQHVVAEKLYWEWAGPFLTPHRVLYAEEIRRNPRSNYTYYRRDLPLDPWGNPYRLYSPIGLIGSQANSTDSDTYDDIGFSNGRLTNYDDRFDRFAVVSYGPDGTTQDLGGGLASDDDDIIHLFSGHFNETSFAAFY